MEIIIFFNKVAHLSTSQFPYHSCSSWNLFLSLCSLSTPEKLVWVELVDLGRINGPFPLKVLFCASLSRGSTPQEALPWFSTKGPLPSISKLTENRTDFIYVFHACDVQNALLHRSPSIHPSHTCLYKIPLGTFYSLLPCLTPVSWVWTKTFLLYRKLPLLSFCPIHSGSGLHAVNGWFLIITWTDFSRSSSWSLSPSGTPSTSCFWETSLY